MSSATHLSRIDKLFLDRDGANISEARKRRERFRVVLACGADVGASRTLQASVLTAAAIASRCFPGAVRVALPVALRAVPLLVWPKLQPTFESAVAGTVGKDAIISLAPETLDDQTIVFGTVDAPTRALRVTFDGWIAQTGPTASTPRLAERDYCPLAGVLAAALALSEMFLSFANLSLEARRRTIGLSLWRPDLKLHDQEAVGVPLEFLPRNLWILGLGHLGNAYLWTLACLPYADPSEAEFSLFDFDKVEAENFETGLLFAAGDQNRLKTRICSRWLEQRGFQTKLVERRFDATFRCQRDFVHPERSEPHLALCGFDSNAARRDMIAARFKRVVESGLGGTAQNFDTIALHTLPNLRSAEMLWPVMTDEEKIIQRTSEEQMARDNPEYAALADDNCGRAILAGKAVAVPFVGTTAACLVVAEVLRLAHEGMRYTDGRVRLGSLGSSSFQAGGYYNAQDAVGIPFVAALPSAGNT